LQARPVHKPGALWTNAGLEIDLVEQTSLKNQQDEPGQTVPRLPSQFRFLNTQIFQILKFTEHTHLNLNNERPFTAEVTCRRELTAKRFTSHIVVKLAKNV